MRDETREAARHGAAAVSWVLAAGLWLGAACGSDETASETPGLSGAGIDGAQAAGAGLAGAGDSTAGAGWAPVAGASAGGQAGGGVAGMAVPAGAGGDQGPVSGESGAAGQAGQAGMTAGMESVGGTGGTGEVTGGTSAPPAGDNCLQGSGDYLNNGPYRVARKDVTIGAQGPYTIFHPEPLEANCKHPIVAWGNGTAVNGADVYGFFQDHAASWGIVVIASHNANVGSGDFHRAGLDYLIAENDNPSSVFHQKLSMRAGTSGHSQGGMGANAGSSHPRVEAIVNVQGAFGRAPAGKAFLCLTGTADLNPAGCKSSVDGTSAPAMHANWQGGDHFGTPTLGGFVAGDRGTKQYMRLYTAWFRCFLGSDAGACALFMGGTSCPVCRDSGWAEIYARNY